MEGVGCSGTTVITIEAGAASGTIEDGYSYYGAYLDCVWRIEGPDNRRVVLTITELDTRDNTDFVKVLEVLEGQTSTFRLGSDLSGSTVPASTYTTSSSADLFLQFTSQDVGWSEYHSGFTATYALVSYRLLHVSRMKY